jgi:cysteine-rich repeat protein
VTLKGAPYGNDPVAGPTGFVETRLTIGSTDYCGRWAEPPGDSKKNDPAKVLTLGPTAACQVDCGNSIAEAPEQCDDGNSTDGDGCDSNCTNTACGNGIATAGEACDDGDLEDGDGCRSDCTIEVCGDGILDVPAEACDDGNIVAGDCCSPLCEFETSGSPCADDLEVCTDDVCDGAGSCTHPGNAAPCDDGDGCTLDDTCAGGACAGDLRPPWINEFDYDDFFAALDDRDEFIEIAGPAGTDLSGFQVIGVEGGPAGSCFTPISPPQPAIGEANLAATIPPGAVLADDTGTGIGFYVVCFTNTSMNVVNIPACDAVLPGPRTYSNLENGHLLNSDETTCPEGILLLDPDDGLVDAVSYEGVVPNVGTFGPFFHVHAPYSAPRDEGWLAGVSIEKVTSTLERAQSASEWVDPSEVPGCVGQGGPTPPPACSGSTATPGAENPAQTLLCGSPCAAFVERSQNLLE